MRKPLKLKLFFNSLTCIAVGAATEGPPLQSDFRRPFQDTTENLKRQLSHLFSRVVRHFPRAFSKLRRREFLGAAQVCTQPFRDHLPATLAALHASKRQIRTEVNHFIDTKRLLTPSAVTQVRQKTFEL